MNKTIFLILPLLAGCAPVPFKTTAMPPNTTQEQHTLDNLQCSNQSKVTGPWLYGIGTLTYRRMAANRFEECMKGKGYTVEEQ